MRTSTSIIWKSGSEGKGVDKLMTAKRIKTLTAVLVLASLLAGCTTDKANNNADTPVTLK